MNSAMDPWKITGFLAVLYVFLFCEGGEATISEPELIEGDIVLDARTAFAVVDFKSGVHRRKREIVRDSIRVWENGVVPYVISEDMNKAGRKFIRKAFRRIVRRTCIKFIPKQNHHIDYIKFIRRKGCYSSVGRKGGEQAISFDEGCQDRGRAIHELMHALGFFHEHSRFDRDNYVKILWWNIQQGMERNFITYSHRTTDSLGEPYDYSSIMHYDNKAFSKNGRDTIQSKLNPLLRFRKPRALSRVDIKQLNKLYGCFYRQKAPMASCQNMYKRCGKFATGTDSCESSYEFMIVFCPRACAFC